MKKKKMNIQKNKLLCILAFYFSIFICEYNLRCLGAIKTNEYLKEIIDKFECDSVSRESYYRYLINTCFQIQDLPDTLATDYSKIFSLPSFINIGNELFSDNFIVNSPSEYTSDYLYDYRLNYLFFCNNDSVLIKFATLFLSENNSDGILGLWGKLDLSLCPRYQDYLNYIIRTKKIEQLYILIIFAKNIGNSHHLEYLIKVFNLLDYTNPKHENFINFLNQSDYITYEEYLSNS